QLRRVVARVDDRGLCGTALAAHDVAVAPERAHHERVDSEGHEAFECNQARKRISPMQSWSLMSIDAPAGTRDPIVLHSDDGARAVLIVLSPGQSLGDHQVKENTWVTVLEGSVEISAGGEAVEGEPGTMVR